MFLDSDLIQGIRQLMDIDPNTPSEDMFNQVYSIAEQSGVGVLADNLFKAVKLIKQIEAKQAVQVTNSAGGAAVAGEAASKIENAINNNTEQQNSIMPTVEPNQDLNDSNFNIDQNLDLSAEKKNLNFDNNTNPERIEVASAGMGPIFKSVLQSFAKKIPNKGSGQQILSTIKNAPGVKEAELKWTGLDDFLKDKKNVTKEEVGQFLDRTKIDIEEVTFGGKNFGKLSDEIEFAKNDFEKRWHKNEHDLFQKEYGTSKVRTDLRGPDYDNYKLVDLLNDDELILPFSQLKSYFGNDIINGVIKPNKVFKGPEKTRFSISELELEKFKVENQTRDFFEKNKASKFERYTETGGSDYTELVFTVKQGGMDKGIPTELAETSIVPRSGGESFKNTQISKTFTPYKNPSHMNVKSEIAHVRFKTREQDGMKILTVEEMQSDFGIAASKAMANRPDIKITDFPFKNTWYELVTKRLIRHAADNGFDAVAIPKGSTIASRYKQELINSKNIKVYKFKDEISVHYLDDTGEAADIQKFIPDKEGMAQLQKTLGLKIYDKIINLKNSNPQTFPIDKPVSIGEGKGKADLYDKAIPSFMKKYGKKWNAKVYDKNIDKYLNIHDKLIYEDSSKLPVTILEITPEMKKSVQQDGQALFNLFGIAGGSAVGAKAVSDNMKNNTISKPTNN